MHERTILRTVRIIQNRRRKFNLIPEQTKGEAKLEWCRGRSKKITQAFPFRAGKRPIWVGRYLRSIFGFVSLYSIF